MDAYDEVDRMDMIDALADRMLRVAPLSKPATDVWDEAAAIIDARMAREAAADAECARDEWNAS